MIAVENDEYVRAAGDPALDLGDDIRVGARTAQEREPRMFRLRRPVRIIDVDRNDLSLVDQLTDARQEQRAAAAMGSCLDDHVRLGLDDDLLVVPEIGRPLEHAVAEPGYEI